MMIAEITDVRCSKELELLVAAVILFAEEADIAFEPAAEMTVQSILRRLRRLPESWRREMALQTFIEADPESLCII